MEIQSKPSFLSMPISDVVIDTSSRKSLTAVYPNPIDSNTTAPSVLSTLSKPQLMHPDECPESPNLSLQKLLITAFTQSEEYQAGQIEYLQQKQSNLIHSILQQKQKIIDIHNISHSNMGTWQSIVDIGLPLCSSIISLYLGFSPAYSLSKISAICTSFVGFAIAALKINNVSVPSAVPICHTAICNIYMAYINPQDMLTQVINFLEIVPTISEFACNIDNNSVSSDEIVAQKVIQTINRELTNVTGEISRAMQMISEKKKLFSTINDCQHLQNQIAAIGAA